MRFARYSRRTFAFLLLAASLAPIAVRASDAVSLEVAESSVAYDGRTGEPLIAVRITDNSKAVLAQFTAAHVGDKIEIRFGTQLLMSPVVREPITGNAIQIAGKFSRDEAADLAKRLSAGAKIDLSPAAK